MIRWLVTRVVRAELIRLQRYRIVLADSACPYPLVGSAYLAHMAASHLMPVVFF